MTDFLTDDVRAGLAEARKRDMKRRSRFRVFDGDDVYPVLRFWSDGFSLDADHVQHLRGFVDLYDGARYFCQALIVASEIEAGELICTMKRSTRAGDTPPLDYARDDEAPAAYLPRA